MRIFTFKGISYFSIFFLIFISTKVCAVTYYAGKPGKWSEAIWSTTGNAPYSKITQLPVDEIIIKDNIIVDLDIASVSCAKLTVFGVLNLDVNSLIVSGNVILDQGILNIQDGYLYATSDLHIIANGNDDVGMFSVKNGIAMVSGSIFFWKDKIGTDGGSNQFRLLAISESGTINLGGTLVGSNGTDTKTLSQTAPKSFIFKGGNHSDDWGFPSNWSNGKVPEAIDDVFIPVNLTARLTADQVVKGINLFPGSALELGNHSLTVSGDLNNNLGKISGLSGWLKFIGTSIDQVYNASTSIKLPNIEINKMGKSLNLNGPIEVSNQVNVVAGTLESNGYLTLLSTKSTYSQIGILNSPAKVNGAVNVQSFLTGDLKSSNRGSRMISSPVIDNGAESVYKQLQKNVVITGPGGVSNGFDEGGAGQPFAVTLTTYSEPAPALGSFIPVPSVNTRIVPGQSTFLFFRGNKTDNSANKVNAPYAAPEDVIASYKGTINQGPIAIAISKTITEANDANNGINAVGNPYPAAIDWELVYASNNSTEANRVENEIRINKAGGGFITRNALGVVPVEYASTAQFIQPGQGFYIRKKNPGNGIFSFSESHKATANGAARLLTIPSANLLASNLPNGPQISEGKAKYKLLRINIEQNDLKDETLIVFKDGLNAGFDNNDASYFAGNAILVGSLTNDGKVTSINAMPDVKDVTELKLYVSASVSGVSKLNFIDLDAADGYQIFLKDVLFPDKLIDIKNQVSYEFNIDRTNSRTYGNNRFVLIFKPELKAAPSVFTAQITKSNVELNWTTEISNEVDHFEVEVSLDNEKFEYIGIVKNASNFKSVAKYTFLDKSPKSSVIYYRLKQYNKNSSITYSESRKVDLSISDFSNLRNLTVYPNPVSDRLYISYNGFEKQKTEISIFDIHGRKITSKIFLPSEIQMLEVKQYEKGVYFLEVKDLENKKVWGRSKFVIGLSSIL